MSCFGGNAHNASEFHFHLDRAIKIQVPKKAIVIVTDRKDGTNDQTTRTSHLTCAGLCIEMFPLNTVIFLMHTDRMFNSADLAFMRDQVDIKIVDFA